ncbi:hypothetical protein Tco_1101323 [Tanacetum coccineum]
MAEGGQAKDYTKFLPQSEILFSPLGEEDRTEGPMIIEAEIGGHFIHHIYVDGGSASEILYEHCFNRLRRSHMANGTNISTTKDRGCGTLNLYMDEFHGGGILTLRSSRIIPLECMVVFGPEAQTSNVIQAAKERIEVAIHPEYTEQTIAIGSTLTKEGRKAL